MRKALVCIGLLFVACFLWFAPSDAQVNMPLLGVGNATGGVVNNLVVDNAGGPRAACAFSVNNPSIGNWSTGLTNDVLVFFLSVNSATTVSSVVTTGLTWTLRTSTTVGSNTTYEYYAISTGLQSFATITANLTTSPSFIAMAFIAVNGANVSSPFDPNVLLPGTSGVSADAFVTTTNSATLPMAFYVTNVGSPAAGTGFTGLTTAGCFSILEYKTGVTAPQSALDMTLSTGVGQIGVSDAITQ